MKSAFASIVCFAAATCASLQASTWAFNNTTALSDWRTIGQVRQTTKDLQIGPSDGSYAISGITSRMAAAPAKKFSLKVVMSSLVVTVPAPDELENENDIRINIVLSPDPSPAYENSKAVVNVVLFFNSRQGGVFAGIFGKGEGLPNRGTEPLSVGEFLGEGFVDGDIAVETTVDEKGITARFSRGDMFLKALHAPLNKELASLVSAPIYTSVYQQNIGVGSGLFILQSVSRE